MSSTKGEIEWAKKKLTNNAAMSKLGIGSCSIPFCCGRVFIVYKSRMNPTASIVAHPIFPGMFKGESIEVLPCGYQSVNHWPSVNYIV